MMKLQHQSACNLLLLFLLVLVLLGLWLGLDLGILTMVAQNLLILLKLLLSVIMRLKLEAEYLWNEFFFVKIGFQVRVGLSQVSKYHQKQIGEGGSEEGAISIS